MTAPPTAPTVRRWAADTNDDRATTAALFEPLNKRYQFTVDVAASAENAKLPRYFTRAEDGLRQSWAGESVWCNPPFSDIEPWVTKAWREHPTSRAIVILAPSNRTEQRWWQNYVEPYRDQSGSPLTTQFLRGRQQFLRPGETDIGPANRPPFGCCLLVWSPHIALALTSQLVLSAR